MKIRKVLLMAMLSLTTAASAQTSETFTISTLNVDGLPQKILVFNVNADGPGSVGSVRIGKYLLKKGYDLMLMQEDFNYHHEMLPMLEDDYQMDDWSGDVGIDGHTIDYLHLQNHRFECDGLMAAMKKDITVTNKEKVEWTDGFGKFSHALDMMVTKGFRRYEVTLASGTEIVVYNMHMDAEDNNDAKTGTAVKDRQARESQWKQLAEHILTNIDSRPVVVVGDMNSFYFRDRVEELFVKAIEGSGKGTVVDAWVHLKNNDVYPAYIENDDTGDDEVEKLGGETLDKILCVNPTDGQQLRPIAYSVDTEGYQYEGKVLGDHFPVAATFEVVGRKTGIQELKNGKMETLEYYDMQGRKVADGNLSNKSMYIQRSERETNKIIIK